VTDTFVFANSDKPIEMIDATIAAARIACCPELFLAAGGQ
jgi:hypothetical protein